MIPGQPARSPEAEPPVMQKFLHPEGECFQIFRSRFTYRDGTGEGRHKRVPSGTFVSN